jgi:phosphocarrier protein
MVEREVTLRNKYGLHMRPAEKLVSLANKFRAAVKIRRGDEEVNGKSIISVISLGAEPGTMLTVICSGKDETDAAQQIGDLIEDGFGLEEEK